MRERFFEPGAFDAFCRGFTEEMNRLRREQRVKTSAAPREITGIERRQKEILNFLVGGFGDVEVFRREVRDLEDRKSELTAASQLSAECWLGTRAALVAVRTIGNNSAVWKFT